MERRKVELPLESRHNGPTNRIVTSRYTIFTFLPRVLYEQFRRKSNFFFLSLIILQLSLDVPTNPSAYIVAFSVVIVVSCLKQGYEDWLRHQADEKVNSKRVTILTNSKTELRNIDSKDLGIGDIVRLNDSDDVPADMILLYALSTSGDVKSNCEITTANLDGEPNRKLRFCPSSTSLPKFNSKEQIESELCHAPISVEYDPPNPNLYQFQGYLNHSTTLTIDNVLLRGTTIKNSQFVYGLVIYTGNETRLSLNSLTLKRNKFSVVDERTNSLVILMFGLLLVLCSISIGMFYYMKSSGSFKFAWYLPELAEDSSETWLGVQTFFLFLIFLSYLIPISLSVTIELQKFGSSLFFGWDSDLSAVRDGTLIQAVCTTSDLNDELGQINYLLTDKTGTLTENNLRLVECSIGGSFKCSFDGKTLFPNGIPSTQDFLEALALCHTVQIGAVDGTYQGSSSDEEVLVTAASQLNVKYMGENSNGSTILESYGEHKEFKKHFVLEFDSDRKAMSVIYEDSDGTHFMLTKGAESSILPKCTVKDSETCQEHVNEFAKKGLRTLVYARKDLPAERFAQIQLEMEILRGKSPSEIKDYYDKLETEYTTIIGVTGVEDQLQENVPKTLGSLKAAGIKIWMLTGDKMETAVNIGASCGIVPKESLGSRYLIDFKDNECGKLELELTNQVRPHETLIIDGQTFALAYEHFKSEFESFTKTFAQIIFCRMAPLQKAQVVKLIKTSGRVCAVGDGGNDVAMIQEAHVGIGIIGREGRQAARAADFALPNFKCLEKAILVHGYWYYYRLTQLVAYFFYRGLLFVLPQFLYGFSSGFSGESVYHASYMMCYALIFSSVPILIYGLTEQPRSSIELLSNPSLYLNMRGNRWMSWSTLGNWTALLLWHMILIYYLPQWLWPEGFESMDWGSWSHFLNGILVAVTDIKVATSTIYFTWFTIGGQIFSYLSMFVFYALGSEVLRTGTALEFSYFLLIQKLEFWAIVVLVTCLANLPDLIAHGVRRLDFKPTKETKRKHVTQKIGKA